MIEAAFGVMVTIIVIAIIIRVTWDFLCDLFGG